MTGLKRRQARQDFHSKNNSHSGATKPNGVMSVGKHAKRRLVTQIVSHFVVAAVMVFAGWQARSITSMSGGSSDAAPASTWKPSHLPTVVADPPWWIADDYDDFVTRTYMDGLRALRTPNTSTYFTGMCGRYRFDDKAFPDASVIITLHNEFDQMLSLTVHAFLARTPPNLLREIIIVDDHGLDPESRKSVNETELEELKALSPKVKFVQNKQREGVCRARMAGARAAQGDVLVFMDSHVEMLSGTWLQHLLLPIVENGGTLAAQTLDIISDLDWTYGPGSGDLLYGVINDEFWFSYQRSRFGGPDDNGREREAPGRRLPYETPFVPGALLAVRRDWFWQLGGYDEGMYVWGGENTDFAVKVWACGGRIVMVPCSRAGHMYRQHIKNTPGGWPPKIKQELTDLLRLNDNGGWLLRGGQADNYTKVITRNNIRLLERWSKGYNARSGYYKKVFGVPHLPGEWAKFAEEMSTDPYALKQQEVIDRFKCKDFAWFDRHVFYKLTGVHHPWHPKSPGKTWV